MERYIRRIVAQGMRNPLRIIVAIINDCVFNPPPDYSQEIVELFRNHEIHFYRPFGHKRLATIALFSYRHQLIRHSIHQLKFKNRQSYARIYGILIYEVLVDLLSEIGPLYDFTSVVLVVVPSHSRTIRKRGYQVTDLLARSAMKAGLEQWVTYQPRLIRKVLHTPRQSQIKSRSKRLSNPKNAFVLANPDRVRGRNVILLDDVYTTGATLNECGKVLQQSGARRILRITIAH